MNRISVLGPARRIWQRYLYDHQIIRASLQYEPLMLILVGHGLLLSMPVFADDFVDVIGKVWAKKGALACDSAGDAIANATGPFSSCIRLPTAIRVKIVDMAEPQTQAYFMRVGSDDGIPKYAWFIRTSLTNAPRSSDFQPNP